MIRVQNAFFIFKFVMIVIAMVGLAAAMYFAYRENRMGQKKEKRKAG